jgi:carboxyl-terminal processing protease
VGLPRRSGAKAAAVAAAVLTAYVAGLVSSGWLTASPRRGTDSGVLDDAARRIASSSANPVSEHDLDAAAVQGMLRALGDKWSAYYTPSEFAQFEETLDGRYTGIGVWVRRASDGRLLLSSVQEHSPAALAGLRVGDELVEVAGHPVTGMSVASAVALLRGEPGSRVALVLRHGGGVFRRVLRRVAIENDDVTVDTVAPDVGRIRVAAFTNGVGRQVREGLATLRARRVRGVVLDLRDNPGGLLVEAVETASSFLDGGAVVSYQRRGGSPQVLDALGHGDTATPLAVLVNGGTASAAEIVAGALQDRGRAVVIGSHTFGKDTVQEPTLLSDGSAVEITVGRYLTPSGRAIDGIGIEPDIEVPQAAPSSVATQRAVQVVTGLLADVGGRG